MLYCHVCIAHSDYLLHNLIIILNSELNYSLGDLVIFCFTDQVDNIYHSVLNLQIYFFFITNDLIYYHLFTTILDASSIVFSTAIVLFNTNYMYNVGGTRHFK